MRDPTRSVSALLLRAALAATAAAATLIFLIAGSEAAAAPYVWTQHSAPQKSSPHARSDAMMSPYPPGHSLILFGGTYTDDLTWSWTGKAWMQLSPSTSPPTREDGAMAYDAASGAIVMFGGYNGSILGDTWIWNGTTWSESFPALSPPARGEASMVYDAASQRILLFGGVNAAGQYLNDLWSWDGSTWSQPFDFCCGPPAPRAYTSLAYDAAHQDVVLFGGLGVGEAQFDDTWIWNGTTWSQESPKAQPSARYGATMTFDVKRNATVLFGGDDYSGSGQGFADTWVWNGSNWFNVQPSTSPPGRYYASMAYDGASQEIVLFGGLSYPTPGNQVVFGDTWTLQ
jgi:hypothetical protein